MGSGNSVLAAAERHLTAEFNRLRQIDLSHLGTLFVLDSNHDGQVSLQELMKFAALCTSKGKQFQSHEFQLQMQGHCTLVMYDTLSAQGAELFVPWFARLFGEDGKIYTFEEYPGVEFMGRDAAHTIHEMLKIDENYGYDMQSFLDLIQRTGEEAGMMSLQDERLDDLVPVVVLDRFSRAFAEGFVALLAQLHFAPEPLQTGAA